MGQDRRSHARGKAPSRRPTGDAEHISAPGWIYRDIVDTASRRSADIAAVAETRAVCLDLRHEGVAVIAGRVLGTGNIRPLSDWKAARAGACLPCHIGASFPVDRKTLAGVEVVAADVPAVHQAAAVCAD